MRFLVTLVVYIFVQVSFEVTNAKGGGGRGAGGGGSGRGGGHGSRGGSFGGFVGRISAESGRLFTSAERLSSRFIMFRGGYGCGYVLSGHSSDACLPPLDAYTIKDFIDITRQILKIGGSTDRAIELAEQFMKLGVNSSVQTWFDLTLKLFNVHTKESNLNHILGSEIPRNPVDDTLAKVFSADNNGKIENSLFHSSTTPENGKHLITYLRVFNINSRESFYTFSLPGLEMCYYKYKQIINPNNGDLLNIFPSLALLEHSMCRSGASGKSYIRDLVRGGSRSDDSRKTSPRTIKLGINKEYVLSGHGNSECLPSLDAYKITDFIAVTKAILRMGGTTEGVIDLAEQFMNLNVQSSIQTWFDLNLQLFNVTTMPLNLTTILGRKIPRNPLDDTLSVILSADNNDKIENAFLSSPNVKDLMNYLRGFDSESYFFWIDYGVDICYDKYNKIVNPSQAKFSDIFPSLAVLRDSMCRQGAEKASRKSLDVKIWGFGWKQLMMARPRLPRTATDSLGRNSVFATIN